MGIPRLVSPDDHIQEPAHVWETRLPARLRQRARGSSGCGAAAISAPGT